MHTEVTAESCLGKGHPVLVLLEVRMTLRAFIFNADVM